MESLHPAPHFVPIFCPTLVLAPFLLGCGAFLACALSHTRFGRLESSTPEAPISSFLYAIGGCTSACGARLPVFCGFGPARSAWHDSQRCETPTPHSWRRCRPTLPSSLPALLFRLWWGVPSLPTPTPTCTINCDGSSSTSCCCCCCDRDATWHAAAECPQAAQTFGAATFPWSAPVRGRCRCPSSTPY